MTRKREEFLIDLTNRIIRYNRDSESFNMLYSRLKENKLKLHKTYDFIEALEREKELKTVVDKIISILYKPQVKSVTNEVILRSELATQISTDSFIKTTRDPKLWRKKHNEMTPEYVYSIENVDTIDTYENRFISMLVDQIHDELKLMLLHLTPLIETLEDLYQSSSYVFGKISMINDLESQKYPYNNILSKFRSLKAKAYKFAKLIEKRIKHIKGSEFYRFTSKKMSGKNVLPTNILIHNPLYNYCYKFFKDTYSSDSESENKFDTYYYNYVVLNFINYFATLKLSNASLIGAKKVYIDEYKRLRFDEITFKNGIFLFNFKEDENNLGFYINVKLVNNSRSLKTKVDMNNFASNYVLTSFNYLENNKKTIEETLYNIDVNNKFLFVMNNLNGSFNNVINLSYYKDNQNDLIKNIFTSVTMLFDCDLEIIKSKCPVCGNVNVSYDGYGYHCLSCGANYSINHTLKGDLLWVKNMRRVL